MKKNYNKTQKNEFKFLIEKEMELMPYLIEKFPSKSRDNIKSLLRNKLVLVNGKTQTHVKFLLNLKDEVIIGKKEIKKEIVPGLKIIFEDASIIVVNKPAGLLTISTKKEKNKTLFQALSTHVKSENPANKIFVVHRIDRETSGLLVFAKTEEIKFLLQKNWNDTIQERHYTALVEGVVKDKKKTIVSYLKESKALIVHSSQNESYGQKAVTHYELIEAKKKSSILSVHLDTGRKNQIRVHMQEIGHPIVGDKKYGAKTSMQGRIGLHATTLSFFHPKTKELLKFDSKVPF